MHKINKIQQRLLNPAKVYFHAFDLFLFYLFFELLYSNIYHFDDLKSRPVHFMILLYIKSMYYLLSPYPNLLAFRIATLTVSNFHTIKGRKLVLALAKKKK